MSLDDLIKIGLQDDMTTKVYNKIWIYNVNTTGKNISGKMNPKLCIKSAPYLRHNVLILY